MKKFIAILLCFMLLPLNFPIFAFAADEGIGLVKVISDSFDGTAGQHPSGWTYVRDVDGADYAYAIDPKSATNSVLKIEQTVQGAGNTARDKLRRDLGALGNGTYLDKDMVITFRAYDEDGTGKLQLLLRQYYLESSTDKEGHELFKIGLSKSDIGENQGKWLDVRIEVKMDGTYSVTVKDGDEVLKNINNSFDFHYQNHCSSDSGYYNSAEGFWQFDFDSQNSPVGDWYIDDFAISMYDKVGISDKTALENIFYDDFTGDVDALPANWSGVDKKSDTWYVYDRDPYDEDESVLKLNRTVGTSANPGSRMSMYRYIAGGATDYITDNLVVTFRALDEDGIGRLNMYLRDADADGEGPQILGFELEKAVTPDIVTGVWYDCFVEVDTANEKYNMFMVNGDQKITIASNQAFNKTDGVSNMTHGICRLDFVSNHTRKGDWFIDDVHVYRDYRDELRSAAEELTFEDIANGNQQTEILGDLSLVDEVTHEGTAYPVEWESSDENFILPDGTVNRRSFAQDVTLTAKICKQDDANVYVEKTFDVTVYKSDGAADADIIADYIEFYLKEELFTDEEPDSITENLKTLPTGGPEGMTITWESDSVAIDIDGTVTRPDYSAEDAVVTLTATLLLNDEPGTATLTYTVLKKPDPYIDINATLEMLTYTYLTTEDSGAITRDIVLPTEGVGSAEISWESRHDAITETGVVTRGDSEVTGKLIATISNPPASDVAEFTFTVLPTVEKILEIDMGGLDLDGTPEISESFDLPLAGETYGTVFVWESDSEYLVINGDRATVYRPPFDVGDVDANITLTATYGGIDYPYNYPVTILCEGTNEEVVDAVMAQLDFSQLSEEADDSVTQNLALVTELNGVDIVWSVADEADAEFIDVSTGEIFRPIPGEESEQVTLTATFTRGDYVEKSQDYTFTVLPFETDSEVLAKAKESLLPSVISSQTLNMVTENLYLPTTWKYGTTVSWSCVPHNSKYADCLVISGEDGIITRPEWGCTSAKMTLTAQLSYGELAPVSRTYNLEILEKNYMEEYAELWREDFEAWDDAYGDEPDGGDSWSIDGGVETDQMVATIENIAYEYGDVVKDAENNKAFKVDRSVVNTGTGYVYASADKAYGGIVYIGLDFLIPTGGEFKINGRNGAQDQAPVTITIRDENVTEVKATGHTLPVPEGLVKPEAWNRIKLEINVAKEAYHVFINDVCLTDSLDLTGADGVGIDTSYGVPYNYYGQGYESAIKNFRMVFQRGFEEGYYLDNAYMANTVMYTEAQLSAAAAWENGFLSANDISAITDTLIFPTVEAQGIRIFFYSDDSGILDNAGMIQLPSGEADVTFRVGFNDGFTEYTKSYRLHVIKTETVQLTDEESVAADLAAAVDTIKASGMLTSLTGNLTVPATGANGSTITAVSSDTTVLTNRGSVTRGNSNETVTLTVTATKNGVTSDPVVLNITVAKKDTESSTTSPSNSGGRDVKVTYGEQTKADTGVDITQPDEETTDKTSFNDLSSGHWAHSELMYMVENGIMNGTGDGNIQPERKILREEFIKMLVVAMDLKLTGKSSGFSDVAESAWYSSYIAAAKENHLVNGYDDGRVGIGEEISRQDMAVMIFRAAQLAQSGADDIFTDDKSISTYAKNAVYTLKDLGIINGMGDGSFAPKAAASRAETACMLYKAIKKDLFN